MILSNTENSYVLQTQRFIVTNDIQVTRNQSTVSVSADGINVKEIRVMKDGEFLQVHNNQFEVLENGSYDITVIDEYDMVATKTLVVDSFVVGEATTRKMTSSMNKIDYAIVAIGLFMIASSIVVRRKKEA